MYFHSITSNRAGDPVSLSIFPPEGAPVVATSSNAGFDQAVALVRENRHAEAVVALRPAEAIQSAFDRLKEKFLHRGEQRLAQDVHVDRDGRVVINGEEADPVISKTIIRYYRDGSKEDFLPLVRFLQNIADNPNAHSREQLYRWLDHQSFTITQDGCFIGYKGVRYDEDAESYVSITPSRAGDNVEVNGVPAEAGQCVPNPVGARVSMPRDVVNHDPSNGCSTGLHVGTWDYASGFATSVLTVKVDPRDVVSVPTDCDAQKVRACAYEVVSVVTAPSQVALDMATA